MYDKQAALDYHSSDRPGKISIELTTPAETPEHLSLAYSPGVAEPVRAIAEDPALAYRYTIKGNLVAVISNGTAILGLGNLGALASKPVMEGKCLLFKRFAEVDAIDIEVDTEDVDTFVQVVTAISPSFGGINLEDIKAPECFEIEKRLIESCNIPVFHDDQHGTAIVTVAGMLNALELQDKKLADITLVCSGAGAAAIACLNLLISMGLKRENILLCDSRGVVYQGREAVNEYKEPFVVDTPKRTLADACKGVDVFLGLSAADLLTEEMVKSMADKPVIFACANPDPEIKPEIAHAVRSDIIMATGRSDYPNQVNNVLGFPFIFRGALDAKATTINEAMKHAAVESLRKITRLPVSAEVAGAYGLRLLEFGKDYIVPKPLDPRLLEYVPKAVAQAAKDSGVTLQ